MEIKRLTSMEEVLQALDESEHFLRLRTQLNNWNSTIVIKLQNVAKNIAL